MFGASADSWLEAISHEIAHVPLQVWAGAVTIGSVLIFCLLYALVYIFAPISRAPTPSEQLYRTLTPSEEVSSPRRLPHWHDLYLSRKSLAQRTDPAQDKDDLEEPTLFVSLVIPAYNEEERLWSMLEDAHTYLKNEYSSQQQPSAISNAVRKRKPTSPPNGNGSTSTDELSALSGWEIILVSDGSTDATEEVTFKFAREHFDESDYDRLRVVRLERNRGKGGAVIHGLRHVRGAYAIFADADGASRFSDLGKMISACQNAEDKHGRAVAVGSRAHMVNSEAVVQRSLLRNFLMHSFHLLLWLMTPPATSRIKDTQCGFKLFSRPSLPYIVPHMHSDGWIFDVEMLMLAEAANIPMVEVPIGWQEVKGSKLNVLWDSLGMAWGLALLRCAWAVGIYKV